jgi:hypothetical protein
MVAPTYPDANPMSLVTGPTIQLTNRNGGNQRDGT